MDTCRILVTGAQGQLGRALVAHLDKEYEVVGVGKSECDIRSFDRVRDCFKDVKPQIVLHTAAYADVDGCETDEAHAMRVNAEGTEHVAHACRGIGARMIYYSTDYVFDGNKRSPYDETDSPNPQTVYGRSKLEGERRVGEILDNYIILRIAWLYGIEGNNFVTAMVRRGLEQIEMKRRGREVTPLKVVCDQIGSPTWTADVVKQTQVVIDHKLTGLFHCTAEGEVSRYRLVCDVFETLGLTVDLEPCPLKDYPAAAMRPKYTALANHRLNELGLNVMRHYRAALEEFLNIYKEEILSCAVK
jgi:dTDP-4-dehydrorhamnose reductase